MATIPRTLYAANREIKATLVRSKYGIDLNRLRSNNDGVSKLSEDEFTELMHYINSSNTVLFFERDGLECIVLRSNYTEDLGELLDIYQPINTAHASRSGDETEDEQKQSNNEPTQLNAEQQRWNTLMQLGFTVAPTKQLNREREVEINLEPYKSFLLNVPSYMRFAAAEILGSVENLNIGLTISELTRRSAAFDVMDETERSELIRFIDEHSEDFKLVKGGVPTRGDDIEVLLHRQFWRVEHYENLSTPPLKLEPTDSPFASLLLLKGKLPKEAPASRPILSMPKPKVVEETPVAHSVEEVAVPAPEPYTPAKARSVASTPAAVPVEPEVESSPYKDGRYATLVEVAKRVAMAEERLAMAQQEYDDAMVELQSLVLHKDQ